MECKYKKYKLLLIVLIIIIIISQLVFSTSNCPGYDDNTYCWILGSQGDDCAVTCSAESSTCVDDNWNDNSTCSIQKALGNGCGSCDSAKVTYYPASQNGGTICMYRSGGNQTCRGEDADYSRACACNLNDFILSITITSPINNSYSKSSITNINGTTNKLANITYSIDGATNITACYNCTSFNNLTDSLSEGPHNITIYGTAYSDSILSDISKVAFIVDTTAPKSITNLKNQSQGHTWIYWNWTNPGDADFNHTEVWINETFYANVSSPDNFYNATGLTSFTSYEIQTKTVDHAGNINSTWVNDTGETSRGPPTVSLETPIDKHFSNSLEVTFNCSATDNINLQNITLYGNWGSGWHANETKNVSGTSNSTTFTKNLSSNVYLWNCLTYNDGELSGWANSNRTLRINYSDYYVSTTGSDSIGNGTSGNPWRTIQYAIDKVYSGDTIYIENGIYEENIDVNKTINLIGEGRQNTTINASTPTDHIFYVTANNTNISGFKAIGGNRDMINGFYLNNVHDCNISSNIISNNNIGIEILNSHNNIIENNNVNVSYRYGIYIFDSDNNTIKNNIISLSSFYGINIYTSHSNNFTSNIFKKNVNLESGLANDSNNTYYSNQFLDNMNTFSQLETNSQIGTTGSRIDFNFTMKHFNGSDCSSCTYTLDLSPTELNLENSSDGAIVYGNFTPTKRGIYSLKINITDTINNSEVRKYVFLISVNSTDKVDYYFRNIYPTHGQTKSYGSTTDVGSLLFEKPSSSENRNCAGWVGFPLDKLPRYLLGSFRNVNYSIWYQTDEDGYTGIQKSGDFSTSVDYNFTVSTTSKKLGEFNFTINWTNDYFWIWHWMTIKLKGHSVYIYSNSTDPSYANITYLYSDTPAIKNISNKDIQILSATSPPSDLNNATIILDGEGSTNLIIQMYNTSLNYSASYNETNCNDSECNFTQSGGEISFNLDLVDGEHALNIINQQAPNITVNSPENNATINQSYTLINLTLSDINDDILTVWVYKNNSLANTSYNIPSNSFFTYNWTNLTNGDYNWSAKVSDGGYNTTTPTYNFSVSIASSEEEDSSGTDSSSDSSNPTNSFWKSTYLVNEDEFEQGITRNRAVGARFKITINYTPHHIGVVALNTTNVTINVSSETQQATLNTGETKKFDVTNDSYYDLSVKLNSIEDNEANLTLKKINEKIIVEIPNNNTSTNQTLTDNNITQTNTSTGNISNNKTSSTQEKEEKQISVSWLLIVIPILIALIISFFIIRRHKKKKHIFYEEQDNSEIQETIKQDQTEKQDDNRMQEEIETQNKEDILG